MRWSARPTQGETAADQPASTERFSAWPRSYRWPTVHTVDKQRTSCSRRDPRVEARRFRALGRLQGDLELLAPSWIAQQSSIGALLSCKSTSTSKTGVKVEEVPKHRFTYNSLDFSAEGVGPDILTEFQAEALSVAPMVLFQHPACNRNGPEICRGETLEAQVRRAGSIPLPNHTPGTSEAEILKFPGFQPQRSWLGCLASPPPPPPTPHPPPPPTPPPHARPGY